MCRFSKHKKKPMNPSDIRLFILDNIKPIKQSAYNYITQAYSSLLINQYLCTADYSTREGHHNQNMQ